MRNDSTIGSLLDIILIENANSSYAPCHYEGVALGLAKSDYVYLGYILFSESVDLTNPFIGNVVQYRTQELVMFSAAVAAVPFTFVGYRICLPGRPFPGKILTSFNSQGINAVQFLNFYFDDGTSAQWCIRGYNIPDINAYIGSPYIPSQFVALGLTLGSTPPPLPPPPAPAPGELG